MIAIFMIINKEIDSVVQHASSDHVSPLQLKIQVINLQNQFTVSVLITSSPPKMSAPVARNGLSKTGLHLRGNPYYQDTAGDLVFMASE